MILAVANSKGGAGKSAVTAGLAAALAERDQTAILDLDPDGRQAADLGLDEPGTTVLDLLDGRGSLADLAQETPTAGLWVLPASQALHHRPVALEALRGRLVDKAGPFRWVLIDTPPAVAGPALAGLAAADLVLVVVGLAQQDLERLPAALGVVEGVRSRLGLDQPALLVPNRDQPQRHARIALETLRDRFGAAVTRTAIPWRAAIGEAPSYGLPVTAFEPRGDAAERFRALAEEIRRIDRRR